MKSHLLIVDDDANTLASLSRAFRLAGHEATVCDNPIKALEMVKNEKFDLIFSDVVMPQMDGLTLLEQIKAAGVTTPVVMMSGQAHIEMAVKATKLGALDFLEKPLSTDKLLLTVQNALRLERLKQENRQLRQQLGSAGIVFSGEKMRKLMAQVERVAASETRVCILGETGTGKELIARTIHEKSNRRDGPYVTLNCAAVPAELIESELFGHRKGSFTGASEDKVGKFQKADGGTLFLDEVGDMSLKTQSKVLRVLEEQRVERLGSNEPITVDVRVIAATNKKLEDEIGRNAFREDLFYRLNVIPFYVPALRERIEDMPILAAHFLEEFCEAYGKKPKEFTAPAMEVLLSYTWPGNVRELKNLVERLVIMSPAQKIEPHHLPPELFRGASKSPQKPYESLQEARSAYEREFVLRKLEENRWNMTKAAEALGLERSHLYRKMRSLGIAPSKV